MIGFVADLKRVDYWTSYTDYGPIEEFKKQAFGMNFQKSKKQPLKGLPLTQKLLEKDSRKEKKNGCLNILKPKSC